MKILHLGRQTHGDHSYYTRWEEIGKVHRDLDQAIDASVLVVDHHIQVTDSLLNSLPNLKWICYLTLAPITSI